MKKDLLFIVIIIFLAVILFQGVKIQSVEEYYNEHLDEITEESQTVYITIECKSALEKYDYLSESVRKVLPYDGIIFAEKQIKLREGDSVYDLLSRITRVYKIQLDASSELGVEAVYVHGINNLYEFDCGDSSGWRYAVNGVYPSNNSSDYYPKDGDVIIWSYYCSSLELEGGGI